MTFAIYPAQAEGDLAEQPGQHDCTERCVAMALELAGVFSGAARAAAASAFVAAAWQKFGIPDQGTSPAVDGALLAYAGSVCGVTVTSRPLDLGALADGQFGLVNVDMGRLLPGTVLPGSWHSLLAIGSSSGMVRVADPAHTLDWGPDLYSLEAMQAALDPDGPGLTFEIGGGVAMALDPEVQQAMVEMEARQNAALTEMWRRFRRGKFTGADGIDGKIVELQGGTPLDFTPTYPQ